MTDLFLNLSRPLSPLRSQTLPRTVEIHERRDFKGLGHPKPEWNMSICDLPDDVIYLICNYLEPSELFCLRLVCKHFANLASNDSVWIHQLRRCGLLKGLFNLRKYSAMESYRIYANWKKGRFKEVTIARSRKRQIPWLIRHEEELWLSKGNTIISFSVLQSGYLQENHLKCLKGARADVTRFVVKNNTIVSGDRDGSIHIWDHSGIHKNTHSRVHTSDAQCVDFTDSVVVSGSRDTTCKVVPLHGHARINSQVLKSFDMGERVWCLKIAENGNFFAAGLAGWHQPIVLCDLESGNRLGQLGMNHRRGAGLLDMTFESPNELLTCGYDTFIRLWDLRTQSCVRQWEEPYDSALYCLQSDGENTIAVGTARHGMVRLWDKRQEEPFQVYYSRGHSSPVYALGMDYGHLYLALDMGLNVKDFTIK